MKKTYKIDVDCANCANKMELAAKQTKGVKNATVNFMALKMIVEFEEGFTPDVVMPEVEKNCKIVEDDCEIFWKK
ncbi:cation transporter [Floccifex sp.]|uniref:cation transporter n=1 Tax=Floccifex sp. TaxID=2815810 RepID=UPI003F0815C1